VKERINAVTCRHFRRANTRRRHDNCFCDFIGPNRKDSADQMKEVGSSGRARKSNKRRQQRHTKGVVHIVVLRLIQLILDPSRSIQCTTMCSATITCLRPTAEFRCFVYCAPAYSQCDISTASLSLSLSLCLASSRLRSSRFVAKRHRHLLPGRRVRHLHPPIPGWIAL